MIFVTLKCGLRVRPEKVVVILPRQNVMNPQYKSLVYTLGDPDPFDVYESPEELELIFAEAINFPPSFTDYRDRLRHEMKSKK